MSGIGVVLNPKSRRNLRDPGASTRLARTLGDHGVVRVASSKDELLRIAEDFKALSIDVLGISGGDGTNGVTITGFLDVYGGMALPQIALLRGGSMNTVANSVGVARGRPEGLLGKLAHAYAARATRPLQNVERHVMRIGSANGELPDDYGFLFGTGVIYGFLSEYYADGETTPLVAVKTLARAIGSTLVQGEMIRRMARPFRGSVELADGTVWEERDYLAVAAGTVDQIGLNFRPFFRHAERPHTFHALGIHSSPLAFVGELPRIWRAEPMRPGRAHEACVGRMVVRSSDGVMRYMIDGDLHEREGEVELVIGPRVKIVVDT